MIIMMISSSELLRCVADFKLKGVLPSPGVPQHLRSLKTQVLEEAFLKEVLEMFDRSLSYIPPLTTKARLVEGLQNNLLTSAGSSR